MFTENKEKKCIALVQLHDEFLEVLAEILNLKGCFKRELNDQYNSQLVDKAMAISNASSYFAALLYQVINFNFSFFYKLPGLRSWQFWFPIPFIKFPQWI